MPENEDLYEILQVHPSAHPDVIQAAYRRLAFLYHPDRNPSPEAAEMMKRLNLAYETLSDPDRRAAYDRTRSTQQGQRTEAGSRDTRSERPRTSRPTPQSGRTAPTTPPEIGRVNGVPVEVMGLIVVVLAVLVALSAIGWAVVVIGLLMFGAVFGGMVLIVLAAISYMDKWPHRLETGWRIAHGPALVIIVVGAIVVAVVFTIPAGICFAVVGAIVVAAFSYIDKQYPDRNW